MDAKVFCCLPKAPPQTNQRLNPIIESRDEPPSCYFEHRPSALSTYVLMATSRRVTEGSVTSAVQPCVCFAQVERRHTLTVLSVSFWLLEQPSMMLSSPKNIEEAI